MVTVSIILPAYNRASFLPNAIQSIASQTFSDYEVIIVDDGSSDDTEEVVTQIKSKSNLNITFIKQLNMGPGGARNTGIKAANGSFIAFFDSDDTWESDHLHLAMHYFEQNPNIDWLYFSCRRLDYKTGNLLLNSTFYTDGKPNALFSCVSSSKGSLYYLDNRKAALCQLSSGIDSGLQNSVYKRDVFDDFLIPDFRVGEDRLFILKLLKAEYRCAFIDKVTVNYNVHDGNTSDTNVKDRNIPKRIIAMKSLIDSYEATAEQVNLSFSERKALKKVLSEAYIWKLGYSLELENGYYEDALNSMKKGILHWPFRFKYWKTFLVSYLKYLRAQSKLLL